MFISVVGVHLSCQIPTMEVIWSVLTMVLASAKNFETLVAIRFLVGTLEARLFCHVSVTFLPPPLTRLLQASPSRPFILQFST